MKISSIVSTPAFNVARAVLDGSSYTKHTSQNLASLMLREGWLQTSFIGLRNPSVEEQTIMLDGLEKELARLEALSVENPLTEIYKLTLEVGEEAKNNVYTTVTSSLLLQEFKHEYCTKQGNIKDLSKVKAVVFGHHRAHMLLVANAARANNNKDRLEPKTLLTEYKTVAEWHSACIKENSDRQNAATSVSTFDVLRQAHEFFNLSIEDARYTESYHYKLIGQRGLTQQAWRYLKLDAAYPELDLYTLAVGQVKNEENKPVIPYRSLNKEKLQTLIADKETKEMAPSEEVMAYCENPLDKSQKLITISDCKTIAESVSNQPVKQVLNAVNKGDRKALTAFNKQALAYNVMAEALAAYGEISGYDDIIEISHKMHDLAMEKLESLG